MGSAARRNDNRWVWYTLGLPPPTARAAWRCPTIAVAVRVGTLLDEIARRGTAILLVEQKPTIAQTISRRLDLMGPGRIVFEGTPAWLATNGTVRKERWRFR